MALTGGTNVGSIEYTARIDTKALLADAAIVNAETKNLGNTLANNVTSGEAKASAALARFTKVAKIAALAGAAALGIALVGAVKSAADFQSSMSQLGQASSATGSQLKSMSKLARAIGRDNTLAGVTASDAAQAMVELSKAGLSVNETMDASRGVLSLAKAGNIEFADAAVIAASALNAFGLKGKDATKVADQLAAGANASQASLSDLALGLQQSATVAKQFKLSLNENVTALALFANNGIRGSDAGTSLKTMLISLAHPSKQSADAMKDIGFNAYDAAGRFVGLEEMSKRLSKSLSGLTEKQKQTALATIFGTDAFRAAGVLADSAGKKYNNMSKSVGKVGAAQDAARAQMGAFERATEGLSNQLSDVGLTIGNALLPSLTNVVNAASAGVVPAFNGIINTANTMGPAIMIATAAFAGYQAVMISVSIATRVAAAAQTLFNVALGLNPIGIVVGAMAGLITISQLLGATTNSNTSATERLKTAQNNLTVASKAAKDAQLQLRDAELNLEGASLRVERAKINLKNAIQQFGRKSLEAREAALELKRANNDLADASQNVKTKTDNASSALKNFTKAKDAVVAANNAIRGSANSAAGGLSNMAAAFDRARAASARGDVMGANKAGLSAFSLKAPGKKASGGPVSRNTPYFVGDNPDGSLNKTTELFVPRTAGNIINSRDLQSALSSGGGSSSKEVNFYGDINVRNNSDLQAMLNKLDVDTHIVDSGTVPARRYL